MSGCGDGRPRVDGQEDGHDKAVVSMEKSELSLVREEQFMNALMHSVMGKAEMMDTSNHIGEVLGTDKDNWPDESIFMGRNFEQWVEDEMLDM